MKLLKVVNSTDSGGVYTCEMQFIRELKRNGVQVDLIIAGNGPNSTNYREVADNWYAAKSINVSFSGGLIKKIVSVFSAYLYSSGEARAVPDYFTNETYDAVIYRRENLMFLAAELANRVRAPCIWFIPNTIGSSVARMLYERVFFPRLGITAIANSHYTRALLGSSCHYVVYPGFDEERVMSKPATCREIRGIPDEAAVYGMATRLVPAKAVDCVISAFLKSTACREGAHLLIAGELAPSEYVSKIKALAVQAEGQVHLLGLVKDIAAFYSSVDVMINGRKNAEPFGITVAESLGAGKPTIAYSLGGPSEMIVSGENGWLVDPPTSDGYLSAINASYDVKNDWPKIGEFAKVSSKRFSVPENVDRMCFIISDLKVGNAAI